MAASRGAYSWDKYQERQAEVFAAYYLIPPEALERAFKNKAPINAETERFKVARKFNVTEKFASFRLKLYETYERKVTA